MQAPSARIVASGYCDSLRTDIPADFTENSHSESGMDWPDTICEQTSKEKPKAATQMAVGPDRPRFQSTNPPTHSASIDCKRPEP
jgi:hypothetical protein